MKPSLACDLDETKVKFPLIILPKLDGVRGLHITGKFTGRSLKEFKNPFVGKRYAADVFGGLDGELVLGRATSPRLCSETTGFVNRKTAREGKPTESADLRWMLFDFLRNGAEKLPYKERLNCLSAHIEDYGLQALGCGQVHYNMVYSMEDVLAAEAQWLDQGYEGLIARDPNAIVKEGRATTKLGNYLRLKRFLDFEFEATELIEAEKNNNEAKTNELGRTERSSHKENKEGKGMVGTIRGIVLADLEYLGKKVLEKGQIVDVGAGAMTHDERKDFWANPGKIVNQINKAKFFAHGIKDQIRFPTWLSLRAAEDMS